MLEPLTTPDEPGPTRRDAIAPPPPPSLRRPPPRPRWHRSAVPAASARRRVALRRRLPERRRGRLRAPRPTQAEGVLLAASPRRCRRDDPLGRGSRIAVRRPRAGALDVRPLAGARPGSWPTCRALSRIGPVELDQVSVGAGATWSEVLAATSPRQDAARAPDTAPSAAPTGRRALAVPAAPRRADRPRARARRRDAARASACAAPDPGTASSSTRSGRAWARSPLIVRATPQAPSPRRAQCGGSSSSTQSAAALLRDARMLAGRTGVRRRAGRDRCAARRRAHLPARRRTLRRRGRAVDDVLLAGLSDDPALRTSDDDALPRLPAPARSRWRPLCARTASGSSLTRGSRRSSATPASRRPSPTSWNASILRSTWARRPDGALASDATSIATPLVRVPADPLCWAFNLIRFPPTDDRREARRLVEANKTIYRRVRDAGGVLYPVSALPMSPSAWRRHFGAAFAPLAAASAGTIHTACSRRGTRSCEQRSRPRAAGRSARRTRGRRAPARAHADLLEDRLQVVLDRPGRDARRAAMAAVARPRATSCVTARSRCVRP